MITAPGARKNWRNIRPMEETITASDHRRGVAVSQQLYNWLIAPIADLLPADTSAVITIVPHRELFLVPFAALMDSHQKYLIEKHALATAPAAGVLQFTGQKRGMVVSRDKPQLLSVGDPLYPANSGLQKLRGARAEANAIAELFPEDRRNFLQNGDASESEIKRKAPAFTILHFATHGLLNERQPMLSALAFAADSLDDGFLTCAEIFELPQLHADLVVLSACQTGRGEITGDGILGLSRAFLYAGTPALIATQWSIDDESTSFLMSVFYSEYRRSKRKALALRQAQLRTLKKYPAPFYWAAFVLVGED
jgi:CHAT domain-containing protein